MDIGILIYSLQGGGAERAAVNLANQFVKEGHSVSIFVFNPSGQAYGMDERIKLCCALSSGKWKLIRIIKGIWNLRKLIWEKKPDILLSFMILTIPCALFATSGRKTRVIGLERANPKIHNKQFFKLICWLIHFCDGFIFQTEGARQYYPSHIRKKSMVIGNPVVSNAVWNPAENSEFRLCSAGRLHPAKDFETLIKAFSLYIKENKNSRLDIYGEGEKKDELIGLAKSLGVNNKVNFPGFARDVQKEISAYDVFIFSSRAEGMPNALMEAMAIGMPCISTDCDYGPRELIQDGKNGLLVPVGEEEKLKEAICRMAGNTVERKQMGKEAGKVKEKYSPETIAQKYLLYMESVLHEKQKDKGSIL